jgi:phosphoglycolate phosphatase-like HAD superfamily hydrolase
MRPAAVVLDFDGVVLESLGVKGHAFRELFAEYPEHLDTIEQFHYDNAGMSRFQKFTWIYGELLGRSLSHAEMCALDVRFRGLVADAMRSCPFVSGAREFIDAHKDQEQLFIASGTPEDELRAIVSDRGLAGAFRGVYGSPRSKAELLRAIAREVEAEPAALLFIGDGRQDWEAAAEVQVPFVARVPPGGSASFAAAPVAVVGDLRELERLWASVP